MSSTNTPSFTQARPGEPVWEVVEYLPDQGSWTEAQYLSLVSRRRVEFDDGMIEVLPVPTKTHQLIMALFYELLKAFIADKGLVLPSGYRLRISSRSVRFREPDVIYMTREQNTRAADAFTRAAELVMEVVSPDDPARDYVKKRRDYAEAGVPEYWIIDPATREVLVLGLEAGQYVDRGRFGAGQRAPSHRLPGFGVAVDDVLAQIQPQTANDDEA